MSVGVVGLYHSALLQQMRLLLQRIFGICCRHVWECWLVYPWFILHLAQQGLDFTPGHLPLADMWLGERMFYHKSSSYELFLVCNCHIVPLQCIFSHWSERQEMFLIDCLCECSVCVHCSHTSLETLFHRNHSEMVENLQHIFSSSASQSADGVCDATVPQFAPHSLWLAILPKPRPWCWTGGKWFCQRCFCALLLFMPCLAFFSHAMKT